MAEEARAEVGGRTQGVVQASAVGEHDTTNQPTLSLAKTYNRAQPHLSQARSKQDWVAMAEWFDALTVSYGSIAECQDNMLDIGIAYDQLATALMRLHM